MAVASGRPRIELDLPGTSVVIEVEEERLGVLLADYGGRYRHPTAGVGAIRPTHYASAPMSEWTLSEQGMLVPPPDLDAFFGVRPASERLALLEQYRQGLLHAARPPARAWVSPAPAVGHGTSPDEPRADDTTAPEDADDPGQPATLRGVEETAASRADARRLQIILNRCGTGERKLFEAPLVALSEAAQDLYRTVCGRTMTAAPEEWSLWVASLQHAEGVLRAEGRRAFCIYMTLQVPVVETVLALDRGHSAGGGHRVLEVWEDATRGLLRWSYSRDEETVRAVTYVAWASGLDGSGRVFNPNMDKATVDLIAANLPVMMARRGAVRAAVRAGKGLYRVVCGIVGKDPF